MEKPYQEPTLFSENELYYDAVRATDGLPACYCGKHMNAFNAIFGGKTLFQDGFFRKLLPKEIVRKKRDYMTKVYFACEDCKNEDDPFTRENILKRFADNKRFGDNQVSERAVDYQQKRKRVQDEKIKDETLRRVKNRNSGFRDFSIDPYRDPNDCVLPSHSPSVLNRNYFCMDDVDLKQITGLSVKSIRPITDEDREFLATTLQMEKDHFGYNNPNRLLIEFSDGTFAFECFQGLQFLLKK